EQLLVLVRRIVVACPHPGCYRRFGLPEYECAAPTCKLRHRRLVPSLRGALSHICSCGARLPTLILLGRFRLTAYCPHGHLRLPGRSGRVRVEHVPVIGGPDAGKSTFLCLAVGGLTSHLAETGGAADFVEAHDEGTMARALARLRGGERLDKTVEQ